MLDGAKRDQLGSIGLLIPVNGMIHDRTPPAVAPVLANP